MAYHIQSRRSVYFHEYMYVFLNVQMLVFTKLGFAQVVYSDKEKLRALYLQGETKQAQDEWIQCIRLGKTTN